MLVSVHYSEEQSCIYYLTFAKCTLKEAGTNAAV